MTNNDGKLGIVRKNETSNNTPDVPVKKAAVKHRITVQPCGTFGAFSLKPVELPANCRCWAGVVRKTASFAVYHVFLHPCRGGCVL